MIPQSIEVQSVWRLAFAITAAAVTACGGSSSDGRDSVAAAARTTASSTAQRIPSGPPCPATGRWAICSIEKRLKRAGLVARKNDSVPDSRPGFSVKPVAYTIGRDSRLELFIYPDEKALARDVAKLDTINVVPLGSIRTDSSPPAFIRSANLIAVLLSKDAREIDRLSLALTAGALQPLR